MIDWTHVPVDFGLVKATEGGSYVNPSFAANWAGLKAADKWRGVYDFARPDCTDPLVEARFFVATVGPLDPDDQLWLDLEWIVQNGVDVTPPNVGPWAVACLNEIDRLTGRPTGIYSAVSFMAAYGLLIPELHDRDLWLADYDGHLDPPDGFNVVVWQTSGAGTVPGISGDVDTDVAVGEP